MSGPDGFDGLGADDRAVFEAAFASLARSVLDGPSGPAPEISGPPAPLAVRRRGVALGAALAELIADVLPRSSRGDHPRAFAFTPSPASPIARLGDLLVSAANAHAGAWAQAEGPLAVERSLIRFMAEAAGFPDGAGGVFVSGGSAANLTALVAAREAMLPDGGTGTVYLTDETHVSVRKALRIIGVRPEHVHTVASDSGLAMDAGVLATAIAADKAAGRKPFLVVATAGSTRSGAVDPLPAIADVTEREGLWLHVDGALGASALLSPAHRSLLAGVERAHSLSWDAHKWLFQTYGCATLLVRDEGALRAAFQMNAEEAGSDYLGDAASTGGAANPWDLGPEMTRPARALSLWLTLRVLGADAFGARIAHGFRLAAWAEDAVTRTPGWTVLSPARMAILLFRFAPAGIDEVQLDSVNAAAAARLLEDGFATVGTVRLDGRLALRICALHPDATEADMRETVRRLDAFARAALAEG